MQLGVPEFLDSNPGMGLRIQDGGGVRLEGWFGFSATSGDLTLSGRYHLSIDVPRDYPDSLPKVRELDGSIPRDSENSFHLNSNGDLCLGSELGMRIQLAGSADFNHFIERCLVPYLFAITKRLMDGQPLIFGELRHGVPGLVDDYLVTLGLRSVNQIPQAFHVLSLKRRCANRTSCPCGCGRLFKQCKLHTKLSKLRHVADRSWFKGQAILWQRYVSSELFVPGRSSRK